VQYYGWALANRAALLPTRAQLDEATATVEAARAAHEGRLVIDYVVPDYHAQAAQGLHGRLGAASWRSRPPGASCPAMRRKACRA
jgi:PqqA peptide cyclase